MTQLAVIITTPAVDHSSLRHCEHVRRTDTHVHSVLSTQTFHGLRQQVVIREPMSWTILLIFTPSHAKHMTLVQAAEHSRHRVLMQQCANNGQRGR